MGMSSDSALRKLAEQFGRIATAVEGIEKSYNKLAANSDEQLRCAQQQVQVGKESVAATKALEKQIREARDGS